MLMGLQGSVAKLEERTNALGSKLDDVRGDLRGFIRRGEFWAGIGIIVTLLLGLSGIWTGGKMDTEAGRFVEEAEPML